MYKKISVVFLILSLLVSLFLSCEMGTLSEPTESEVIEAYTAVQIGYISGALVLGFGIPTNTISINNTSGVITFSNFDITDDNGDYPYTSISGTVTPGANDTQIFDVTLKGGPVSTVEYTYDDSATTLVITANGFDFTVTP